MSNLEQAIIEKIHSFPPEKQRKVLDYAKSLENGENGTKNQTLWEMIEDLAEMVPDEAWNEIPKDASINIDHYLYGHRKKTK